MLQETSKTKILDLILNIFTGLIVVLIVVIIALQVTIYLNPKVVFNPLPPYDLPEALVLENPTQPSATLELLPTATSELVLTSTETRMPTATEQGTYSNGTPVPEITSLPPTETPFSGYYAFVLQNDINAIESTLFKPNYGCNWIGVAGQVFDLQARPVMGVRVWLRGTYNGKRVDLLSLTLESSPYGPSGFEFTLGDTPLNSTGQLSIQLLDQANIPISDRVYFDTFEDCQKNLILINFKQIR
ncbi:MAG: hypothetical protein CVU40_08360 [Chloroflexi bacterium HGW-Chloroflexi-2]|nr:MAG: hypothetical protein CVU40_08360 [Chloroflexi bacterium HGW-Chloroflexi-2]